MAATSKVAPDEGIPLLVPNDLYRTLIGEVQETGFAKVRLRGRTRFIRKEFEDLFAASHGVPRLYVEVAEAKPDEVDDAYG